MSIPLCHPLLQLPQQVFVELIQLRQVVQDLTEGPLIHHWLPILTGCLGNSIPEVLQRHTALNPTHTDSRKGWHKNTTKCAAAGQEHRVIIS